MNQPLTRAEQRQQILDANTPEWVPRISSRLAKIYEIPAAHLPELALRLARVAAGTCDDEYVRDFRACRVDDLEGLQAYEANRDTDYCAYEETVTLDGVTYQIGCSWGD